MKALALHRKKSYLNNTLSNLIFGLKKFYKKQINCFDKFYTLRNDLSEYHKNIYKLIIKFQLSVKINYLVPQPNLNSEKRTQS